MMKTIQVHLTLSLSISQPDDEDLMVPRDILISYVTGSHRNDYVMVKRGMIYTPHFMAMQLTRLIILGAHTAKRIRTAFLNIKSEGESPSLFLLIKCNVMYSLFIKTFNNFYN